MKFRFSIVIFDTPETRVGIVGSVPSLGSWKAASCVPLQPVELPTGENFPTLFTGVVNIPEIQTPSYFDGEAGFGAAAAAPSSESDVHATVKEFEYKYIIWKDEIHSTSVPAPKDDSIVPLMDCKSSLTGNGYLYTKEKDLDISEPLAPLPTLIRSRFSSPPFPHQQIIWEGRDSNHNRKIRLANTLEECGIGKPASYNSPEDHVLRQTYYLPMSKAGETPHQMVYVLPPHHFLNPQMCDTGFHHCEYIHTTKYYLGVRDKRIMHFNKIIPRVFVGSCPRRVEHFTMLKEKYNVNTIFNFQTKQDISSNWPDEENYPSAEGRTIDNLRVLYERAGLQSVWMPTTDMSTEARGAMMAQAAWLLAGVLIASPYQSVYIHCNAGVGRAIACISAFLHFCLGLSEAETFVLVTMRRPVAFVDGVALRQGKREFEAKYGKALTCLPLLENSQCESGLRGCDENSKDRLHQNSTKTQKT